MRRSGWGYPKTRRSEYTRNTRSANNKKTYITSCDETSTLCPQYTRYVQRQEKEAADKANKKIGRTGKLKEFDMAEVQKALQHLVESNSALRQQVIQLSQELVQRDQEVQKRDIKHQKRSWLSSRTCAQSRAKWMPPE
jgi:hypothetical protein